MIIRKLACGLALLLSGCSGSNLTGTYVGGDQTTAIKLDLVEQEDGKLSGGVAVAQPDYEHNEVKVTSKVMSGVSDHGQLSMIAHANDWGVPDRPLSIAVQGSSLVLKTLDGSQSVVLRRSDQQDYINRVAFLRKDIIETNAEMAGE